LQRSRSFGLVPPWPFWPPSHSAHPRLHPTDIQRQVCPMLHGEVPLTQAQACPLTERNQEKIKLWNKCHYAVGGCLFFDADRWGKVKPEKRGENGVPVVDRDENGHPVYPRLWRFLERQGGMYSPDLKNLLNRMLDVDPRKRIKIEEVCSHPWLQSHQAPRNYFLGPQPAPESLEKPKDKAAFMKHMRMRTAKYIEKATPGKQVLFLFFFFLNASLLRPFFLRRKGEGRLGSALRGNSRGSRGVCEDRRWTYPPARVPSSGCAARLLFIMPRISPAFHQHFTPALCRPKHWNTPRD